MLFLKEALEKGTTFLSERGVESARREAELLFSHLLKMKRLDLYLNFDRPLDGEEMERARATLVRRSRGEPLAYIFGEQEFLGCYLKVTPDVLIPRQETEILASMIVKELRGSDQSGKCLWDLCCGSGCLGIALKRALPALAVELSDLSSAALRVAEENSSSNGAEVTLHCGDLLQPFSGRRCDYLVCNPPYISEAEYGALSKEVRDFEPKMALVADEEGLAFYKKLAVQLPESLMPGGKAWFEIGYQQGERVQELFRSPIWKRAELSCDWAGCDRFFFLEKE